MRLRINATLCVLIFASVRSNRATGNDDKDCRCVSIFLCYDDEAVDDGNIDLRPMRSVVVRKKDDCDSALEICCDPDKIMPEVKHASSAGCGIRNFDGIDLSTRSSVYDETKFGEFPWTIAVLHNRPDKQDEYICDGALIHRKVVLTAAHCVTGKIASRIKIRAGEWDTQTIEEILPHQDRGVENILIHANYSSRLFQNDIALLILSRSLEITKNVNVICLPESVSELDMSRCLMSGWSRHRLDGSYEKVLKKTELHTVSRALCQKTLRQARLGNNFALDKSIICAGDALGNKIWKGDGGSPFVCPLKIDSQRFVQIGVLARDLGRSTRIPNIFANALHARSWIDEQLLFYNLDNTEYRFEQYEN